MASSRSAEDLWLMVISERSVNRAISLCLPNSSMAFSSNFGSPQLARARSLVVRADRTSLTSADTWLAYSLINSLAAYAAVVMLCIAFLFWVLSAF